jgi:hypothetical protein
VDLLTGATIGEIRQTYTTLRPAFTFRYLVRSKMRMYSDTRENAFWTHLERYFLGSTDGRLYE